MIQNQRQYNATKAQIARLTGALEASKGAKEKMHPRIYAAMMAGIQSQIDDMKEELREYEELQQATSLRLSSADDFGRVLIKGRIARGLTQKQLAERLRLKPQQIQKYEATDYQSASFARILRVMQALDLNFETDVVLRESK